MRSIEGVTLLPFLRWAGGKRKLAELITGCIPTNTSESSDFKFHEPFVGGGAVMLHLGDPTNKKYISGSRLNINDMNPDLVMAYKAIQADVFKLMELLDELGNDISKEAYLRIRENIPSLPIERAARFIYLNKTGFNGLWRVNNKGLYNVPWGQIKNPTIYVRENLIDIAERLKDTNITHLDYRESLAGAQKSDVVYFDPPYIPLNASSSFSKYAKDDFGMENQKELSGLINDLDAKGVNVILSNSDTPETREIFGSVLNLYQIEATRVISANSSSRGKVKEIIGVNFDLENEPAFQRDKMTKLFS